MPCSFGVNHFPLKGENEGQVVLKSLTPGAKLDAILRFDAARIKIRGLRFRRQNVEAQTVDLRIKSRGTRHDNPFKREPG